MILLAHSSPEHFLLLNIITLLKLTFVQLNRREQGLNMGREYYE